MKNKDRRLRILWNSNSVTIPSGYGIFSRDLLFRLLADNWLVAQSAYVGLTGAPIGMNGLMIYPNLADQWGSDAMVYHGRHFNANVVFTMQDVWALNPQFLEQLRLDKRPFIPYVPIDQEPISPQVLDRLRYAHKIITFSKFGQKALEKVGFASSLIVEGTDTNIFKPMDKIQARKDLNLPQDKFIFGMIGANKDNPPRKGWQEALEAFKLFHDKHPDSLYFFQTNQHLPSGFPIMEYAHYLGLDKDILRMDDYMALVHAGSDTMARIINASDVILHPSTTEGFGLVIIETQACGVPIIVNNAQSQPELVIEGVTGEICKTARKHFSPAQGFWYFADVPSLYDKMEKLYQADRKKMGIAAREHIVKNYNIDTLVKEQWIPMLEELQEELMGPLLTTEAQSVNMISTK